MIVVPYCVNLVLASCPNVRCANVAFLLSDLANDSNASVLILCRLLGNKKFFVQAAEDKKTNSENRKAAPLFLSNKSRPGNMPITHD